VKSGTGTGWLPRLLATESEIFKQTDDLVRKNPSPAELAEFEKATAARVLSVLHGIQGTPPAIK
jgi:hypothetical protein